MSAYVKSYDSGANKWMSFLIENEQLIEKYNILNKISNSMKTEFHSKSIYNKKPLKTKINTYGNKAKDFPDKEILKVGSNYTSLAVILIDFILRKEKIYYPQMFLKECKYFEKEKMVNRHITEDLEISYDDLDEFDEE